MSSRYPNRQMAECPIRPGCEVVWTGRVVLVHGEVRDAMIKTWPGRVEVEIKDTSQWHLGYYPVPGGVRQVSEYRPPLTDEVAELVRRRG